MKQRKNLEEINEYFFPSDDNRFPFQNWMYGDSRTLKYKSSLRTQGINNNIIKAINDIRKTLNCDVTEKLNCVIVTDNPVIIKAISIEKPYIGQETLTTGLLFYTDVNDSDISEYHIVDDIETVDYYPDPDTNESIMHIYTFKIGLRGNNIFRDSKQSISNGANIIMDQILDLLSSYSNRSIRQTKIIFDIIDSNKPAHMTLGHTISLMFTLEYILKKKHIVSFDLNYSDINRILDMIGECDPDDFNREYEIFKEQYNKIM